MPARHKVADAEDLPEDDSHVLAKSTALRSPYSTSGAPTTRWRTTTCTKAPPLCEGELRGSYGVDENGWEWTYDDTKKNVICPWHGWKFDVTTGQNINDERYATPTYDVEVEDGEIFVLR